VPAFRQWGIEGHKAAGANSCGRCNNVGYATPRPDSVHGVTGCGDLTRLGGGPTRLDSLPLRWGHAQGKSLNLTAPGASVTIECFEPATWDLTASHGPTPATPSLHWDP